MKAAHLNDQFFYQLSGEITKIEIELEALQTKIGFYIVFVLSGIIMIIWGFIRWKRKDQSHRDAILVLEKEIKSLQRDKIKANEDYSAKELY